MSPGVHRKKSQKWAIEFILLCTLGILTLLFFGQLGGQIATVLSLLLAFLGTRAGTPSRPILQHIQFAVQDLIKWNNQPRAILRNAVILLSLGAGVAGLGSLLLVPVHASGVQIADLANIEKGDEMTNGSDATIRFPTEEIANHAKLNLTTYLDNKIGTGDCYQSAEITLIPTVNGKPGPSKIVKGREGRATIDIDREGHELGGSDGAAVKARLVIYVTLRVGEGCKIKLSVTDAFLHS